MTNDLISSVHIYSSMGSPFGPPGTATILEILPQNRGNFLCHNIATGESYALEGSSIKAVFDGITQSVPEPDPSMFGVPASTVRSHFGSLICDGSMTSVLLELKLHDGTVRRCLSGSNHAFMLPFWVNRDGESWVESFNRYLSDAIVGLLPSESRLAKRIAHGVAELNSCHASQEHFARKAANPQPGLPYEEIQDMAAGALYEMLQKRPEKAEYHGKCPVQLLRYSPLDTVSELIRRGADPNALCEHGQTALMYAANRPFDTDRFALLLELGADVNARRPDGVTGLHLACYQGELEAAKHWVGAGADANIQDRDGCTPLMYSVRWDGIVDLLVTAGAAVNTRDERGATALVHLIERQRPTHVRWQIHTLEILLRSSADVALIDNDGLTPVDHAAMAVKHRQVEMKLHSAFHKAWPDRFSLPRTPAELRAALLADDPNDTMVNETFDTDYDGLGLAQLIHEQLLAASH